MNLLLYMAPIATAALVPATLILEPNAIATARTLAAEHPCALDPFYLVPTSVQGLARDRAKLGVGMSSVGFAAVVRARLSRFGLCDVKQLGQV